MNIIDRARREGKLIHCSYQNLWFTPDELERARQEGRFRWADKNFTLRGPEERRRELEFKVNAASAALRSFDEMMELAFGNGGVQ